MPSGALSGTDQTSQPAKTPFLVTRSDHKGVLACGLSQGARLAGLQPGMRLSEARSIVPDLVNINEDPGLYARYQTKLIKHLDRYSPWIAPDRVLMRDNLAGEGGFWLEMTGGSHLFGGEETLIRQVQRDLTKLGFSCKAGMADSAGAAWACARFHAGDGILSLPAHHDAARSFPIEGLRLSPDILATLHRLGIRHLHDVADLPRATLTTRLGPDVLQRLDQFYGRLPEHLNFHLPDQPWLIRQQYGEPLGDAANLEAAIAQMIAQLCTQLQRENKGLRRIILRCVRVDGHAHTVQITTSTACQSAPHIDRLLAEKMPGVDTGFGIEEVIIYAPWVEHVAFRQISLDTTSTQQGNATALAELFDRIGHHLGPRDQLFRPGHHASHLPENAASRQPVGVAPSPARLPDIDLPKRPIRLIDPPEPVQILRCTTNGAPAALRWRRMDLEITTITGPERICPEWWDHLDQTGFALHALTRDYFRIHDHTGRWLWICRTLGRSQTDPEPDMSFAPSFKTGFAPPTPSIQGTLSVTTSQPPKPRKNTRTLLDLWSVHGLFA
ncbi:Y-family DNA polymerase [Thalassospira mesophila]|uniref:Y-family DNA polymerase n=1 Tax=Thalassospira mesophila TaxID=1293891 RepID=UPI000A1D9E91|nr:DNA polymerase Y family protein [Thalassospira mesophila]